MPAHYKSASVFSASFPKGMGEQVPYSRTISAVLLCLVAALGYTNWTLARHEIDISPLTPTQVDGTDQFDPPVLPADTIKQPLSDYRETVTRPLFSPTRTPAVAAQAGESSPQLVTAPSLPEAIPVEPSRLKVAGVILLAGRIQRALIRAEGQPHGKWVDVGSEIQGWKLMRIEQGFVVVQREGSLEELRLHSPPR